MHRFARITFSMLVPLFLFHDAIQNGRSWFGWSALTLLFIDYLLLVWRDGPTWKRPIYIALVLLPCLLTLLVHQFDGYQPYDSSFLLPLTLLLAREQDDLRRLAQVLALLTLLLMLAIAPTIPLALAWLTITVLLFLNVRAITLYKNAHRLSQSHLHQLTRTHQELEHTYAALQQETLRSMHAIALAERMRIAHDIHDGIGHQLTALIVQLQALEIMLPQHPQQAAGMVPLLLTNTRAAMHEVRQAAHTWQEQDSSSPSSSTPIALHSLVSQLVQQTHLTVHWQQDDPLSDWPVEISLTLYRVMQEALTNILRHAHATTVEISLAEHDQQVLLTIADNGCFTTEVGLSPGFGINGMLQRCQALGGSLHITQHQNSGLELHITLPIAPHSAPLPPQLLSQQEEHDG